ncbi:MAG: DUF3325 domain-containing protein [Novosphingobium sp.]
MTTRSHRIAIASRILAASLGGYAVTSLVIVALGALLPIFGVARSSVILGATITSFPIWAGIVMAVFHARTARRAWAGLAIVGAPLGIMNLLGSFILLLAGFMALALSLGKHHRDLFETPLGPRRMWGLRVAGGLLLCTGIVPAVRHSGHSAGPVLWTGLLAVAATTVALLLTYKDNWWRK